MYPQRPIAPHVRLRKGSDLDRCVQLLAEVHELDGYPVNWPTGPAGWLSPRPLIDAWVAESDGQVVGHVGLSRSEPGDAAAALWSRREGVSTESAAVVGRLFVAPSVRGCGIGALLMDRVTGEARERGLQPVLDVVTSDTSAAALYERLGWENLGTVDQRWNAVRTVTVQCFAAPAPDARP